MVSNDVSSELACSQQNPSEYFWGSIRTPESPYVESILIEIKSFAGFLYTSETFLMIVFAGMLT